MKKITSTPLILKAKIRGLTWVIKVFSAETYPEGTDSLACCHGDIREIWFNAGALKESIVRHELMHAYIASSFDSYTDVDVLEEQCAEIFEHFGPQMVREAKSLYKKINKGLY